MLLLTPCASGCNSVEHPLRAGSGRGEGRDFLWPSLLVSLPSPCCWVGWRPRQEHCGGLSMFLSWEHHPALEHTGVNRMSLMFLAMAAQPLLSSAVSLQSQLSPSYVQHIFLVVLSSSGDLNDSWELLYWHLLKSAGHPHPMSHQHLYQWRNTVVSIAQVRRSPCSCRWIAGALGEGCCT